MRRLTNNPKYILVHHTGGSDSAPLADTSHHTLEMVNEAHRVRFNYRASNGTYCGYHYFLTKKGKIFPATPENEEGVHTIGHNLDSIGICLAGNFDATLPTPEQINALRGLLVRLGAKYKIPYENIVPHRAFATKTCYGKKLAD